VTAQRQSRPCYNTAGEGAGQLPLNSEEHWPVRSSHAVRPDGQPRRQGPHRLAQRCQPPVPDSRRAAPAPPAAAARSCRVRRAEVSAGRRIELLNYCPAGWTGPQHRPPATLLGRAGTPPKSRPTNSEAAAGVGSVQRLRAVPVSRIPFYGRLSSAVALLIILSWWLVYSYLCNAEC